MRILAIIPARSGSKGLPGKNLRPLAGKSLIVHSLDAARACPMISEVVVTSDSEEIGNVAISAGAIFVRRPNELAQDATPMEPVLQHALRLREESVVAFDAVLLLQPTSPLRTREDIEKAIELFSQGEVDTVLSAYPFHGYRYQMKDGAAQPQYQTRRNRQDREEEFVENGAIYLTRADLIRNGIIFGERLCTHVMPFHRSIDIDTVEDLYLAEALCSLVVH